MRTTFKFNNINIASNDWIRFEWPFWIGFLIWSILPDIRTPKFEVLSVLVNSKDIIIVILAYVYILWPKIKDQSSSILNRSKGWHGHLPIATIIILIYAAVSLEKSGLDKLNSAAMLYTLVVTAATAFLGYILIAKIPSDYVLSFLWRLTIFLSVLGLIYSLASFFSLGFANVRQSLNSEDQEFGIIRVAGPLFIASKGCFIFVPALALSIQECFRDQKNIVFKSLVLFVLTLTIFGLGSRSGLVVFGFFLILIVVFSKNKKQALISTFLISILTSLALIVILSKANPDRLKTMEDQAREGTYKTSFQIIMHRNAELNFFGSGYGSYWPWYIPDITQTYHLNGRYYSLINPFGYILYHPHSTFLLFIVELGVFGFLYYLYLWIVLTKLLFTNEGRLELSILKCGIFASGCSMFFDFFLFKEAPTNLLWWIFLFGTLSLNSSSDSTRSQDLIDESHPSNFIS